jgi:ABC-type transport system involved in multi-copper enzyme maturation permease subunit
VLRAEWTKFISLRSSYATVLAAVLLGVGISAISAAVTAHQWPTETVADRAGFDAVATSLNGIYLAQLALGALGVLLVTGEYSTGLVRSTMTAVPRRQPVLLAKLVVYGAVTTVAAFVISFAAFVVGQALLRRQHIQAGFATPGAARMVAGAALYLIVVGLLAVAIGQITRNTAAGLSVWVAIFFVLPPVFFALPRSFSRHVEPYLPAGAGQALWTHPDLPSLSPWAGFAVLCAWTVAALLAAAVTLSRRDA